MSAASNFDQAFGCARFFLKYLIQFTVQFERKNGNCKDKKKYFEECEIYLKTKYPKELVKKILIPMKRIIIDTNTEITINLLKEILSVEKEEIKDQYELLMKKCV